MKITQLAKLKALNLLRLPANIESAYVFTKGKIYLYNMYINGTKIYFDNWIQANDIDVNKSYYLLGHELKN